MRTQATITELRKYKRLKGCLYNFWDAYNRLQKQIKELKSKLAATQGKATELEGSNNDLTLVLADMIGGVTDAQ